MVGIDVKVKKGSVPGGIVCPKKSEYMFKQTGAPVLTMKCAECDCQWNTESGKKFNKTCPNCKSEKTGTLYIR